MPVRLSDVSEGIRLSDIPDEPKKAIRLSDVPEVKKKPTFEERKARLKDIGTVPVLGRTIINALSSLAGKKTRALPIFKQRPERFAPAFTREVAKGVTGGIAELLPRPETYIIPRVLGTGAKVLAGTPAIRPFLQRQLPTFFKRALSSTARDFPIPKSRALVPVQGKQFILEPSGTGRVVKTVSPGKAVVPIKQVSPIAREALKFKTAEEFVRKTANIQINGTSRGNEVVRLFPKEIIKGKGITTNELFVQLNKTARRTGSDKVFGTATSKNAIGFYKNLVKKGLLKNFVETKPHGFKAELTNKAKQITDSQLTDIFNQAQSPIIKQPSVIQRTSDVIRESVGKVKDKGKLFRDTAEVQLVDRFAPIRNFVAMTEEVIGKPVNFADNPHIGARLYAGVGGKIKQRLNLLGDIIRPERKNIRFLNEIMKNERFIERANRGFLNPGNATAKSAQDSLNNLKARIGNATFDRLKNTANRVRRELTDKLLIESRDAGVISQEAFKTIQAKNQFYSPFDVLEFMADNLGRFPGGKRSFSVATQDIIKPIKGTIKDIDEPLTAIVRKIFKVVNINERNKVAQKMVNLRNLSPNMKEFVIPLKEGQIIPRGMDRFSALFDGTKKSFAIPSEVAESLKGLNAENMDLLTNLASIGTRALRTGATQLNLAFALPNVLRDFQTAKLVSKTGFNVRNWVRGLASVLKKDQMFNLYEESGASFSGFFQRGRRLPASIQEIVGPSISKKIIKNLNPFKVIAKVAETSELTTRVGVFKRALKSGLSRTQAAFEARESTIDFAKMGTKMKIINQWVPFLNARLQGSLNVARVSLTPKSPRFNPARAAWLASSMVTLPQVTTYMWNTTNYPDVWDDLRDFEKDRNFIFIYGKDKDEEGRWLNIVKIPKGDFGRLVGNPVQDFLEFWRGTKPVDFGQTALKTISDFSPIEFEREGKLSAGVALSSGLPPAAKAAIEARTGVSLYTGFPTVSRNLQGVSPREQFTEKTPKALVQLGRTFNISPIKLDRSLRTVFGGLGSQIPAVVSGVGGATGLIPGGEFGRGLGLAQRFVGAKGGQLLEQDFELVSEISKDIKDVKIRNQREALKILERSKQIPIGEERKQFLREEFQDKPKLFKVFVDLLVKGEDEAIFRFIKSLPIEGRIRYVKERITTMDTEEERIQFFNLMRDKEIISKGFIKELFK